MLHAAKSQLSVCTRSCRRCTPSWSVRKWRKLPVMWPGSLRSKDRCRPAKGGHRKPRKRAGFRTAHTRSRKALYHCKRSMLAVKAPRREVRSMRSTGAPWEGPLHKECIGPCHDVGIELHNFHDTQQPARHAGLQQLQSQGCKDN